MSEKKKYKGIVHKAVSGFYYIWSDGKSYTTKAKGLFRHRDQSPLVGDRVEFELDEGDDQVGRLVKILDRSKLLKRPPIANVDHALTVSSLVEPDFSLYLLDSFLVYLEDKRIKPYIILTKYDRLQELKGQDEARAFVEEIASVYRGIGYPVLVLTADQSSVDELSELIEEGIYVIMGQSGVGKSTMLNRLIPGLDLETKSISESLNRGRHTTRVVSLYPFGEGLLADTPGFSNLDLSRIAKDELRFMFPEMVNISPRCRFRTCLHLNEPKCAVKEAVETGEISQSRYDNYKNIYQQLADLKPQY